MKTTEKLTRGLRTFAADVAQGVFEITHSGFAILGLAVMFTVITLVARPELRQAGELQLFSWLQSRQSNALQASAADADFSSAPSSADTTTAVDASDRVTATNPRALPKQQAAVAFWLSKKYYVAPEPLSSLVAEAYVIGERTKLDPTLILAVMAIESRFNPFAQSQVGAQGLMQVMTKIHRDKYQSFGGQLAAFDPLTNLRVGVKVLQECISRAGSVEGGLRYYVGAANIADDGGYASKVLAEHARLKAVANGQNVPVREATATASAAPTPAAAPAIQTPSAAEMVAPEAISESAPS